MGYRTIDLNEPANFAPFDGDGRKKVSPSVIWLELRPEASSTSMTRGMARMTIEKFNESGFMKFEASGGALWVIETWCFRHNVDIKVVKHPFGGWYVQQLEQDTPAEPAFEPLDEFGVDPDDMPYDFAGDYDDIPRLDGRIRIAG